ncbi:hypothetical protein DBB_9510 [Desulfoluna spongiiphila]|nr:hypothetical protein DBB_9510 [Desulfoluna spongiiphila]
MSTSPFYYAFGILEKNLLFEGGMYRCHKGRRGQSTLCKACGHLRQGLDGHIMFCMGPIALSPARLKGEKIKQKTADYVLHF